jgi:histidine triad (HIT) family protein
MSDCIFCRIAAGEIPARVVHQDADCLAFHDLNPQAPVHVLVIPRRHVASLADDAAGDVALLGALVRSARSTALALGLGEGGFRLVINTGEGAGQSVFHLHAHVLGGRPLAWPPG